MSISGEKDCPFRTFNELLEYERTIDKKKSTTNDKDSWLKSKGEY